MLVAAAGDIIFREGDPGACAYLIESGELEILVERAGKTIVLARRGPGEIVGEMAVIDSAPRSATVRALSDTILAIITDRQLMRRIESTDPVVRMCMSTLIGRFRATMSSIGDATNREAPEPRAMDDGDAVREIRLEQALREALRQEHFEVHYQPIVSLADKRVAGFEALVRWRHPERGLISPAVFLPTAEASGLIGPISVLVTRQAFRTIGRLAAAAGSPTERPLFMSINLSPADFMTPEFVKNLSEALDRAEIDPRRIKLEITESLLMENMEGAAAKLASLREMGFSIAIDDFGTGYSSLSYLHRFPIDTIKIDRSFVCDLGRNDDAHGIVVSILQLTEKLGLDVVAEGIETAEQSRILLELGCRMGQGYLFGRPRPEAVLELPNSN